MSRVLRSVELSCSMHMNCTPSLLSGIRFIANFGSGELSYRPCSIWKLSLTVLSALYNASELIYDPYSKSSETLLLPGVSGNTDFHTGGITYDERSRSMLLVADDSTAFATNASGFTLANLTGPNRLLKYNIDDGHFEYDVSMSGVQDQVLAETGLHAAGFQDACWDSKGNAYMLASFGSVIARVTPSGDDVSLWYRPSPYKNDEYGFTGLFTYGDKLIVSDTLSQGLVTFDTNMGYGTPKYVKPNNLPSNYTLSPDGLHAPSRYGGRVALWADDYGIGINPAATGGVAVFGSLDGWNTARFLGFVPNEYNVTGVSTTTSTVVIVDTIYLVAEYFQSSSPSMGRTKFPFVDITEQVDKFVREWECTE